MVVNFDRILVTSDLSDCSFAAIPAALELARAHESRLFVLSVIPPVSVAMSPYEGTVAPLDVVESAERSKRVTRDKLDEKMKELAGDYPYEIVVTESARIAAEIVEQIAKLDVGLLVLATHGRTGLAHVLYGSTAEKLVRTSPVPVLSVRSLPVPVDAAGEEVS